jgi:hypothetical protein
MLFQWFGLCKFDIIFTILSGDEDNFTQVGQFFRNVLSAAERERLTDNIAGNLSNAQEFIQTRAIANFAAADVNYGRLIREKIARIKASKVSADVTSSGGCPYGKANKLSPPRQVLPLTGRAKL